MAQASKIGKETAQQVVALREKWHTKNHPFFVEFAAGKIGLKPVGLMMAQHYQHVMTVSPVAGISFYKAPPEAKLVILENIAEEHGLIAGPGEDRKAVNHMELIFRFCRATGLTDEEVHATEQLPGYRARSYFYINTVQEQPFGVIAALMVTQEGQQPALNAERMLPGFQKHHGFKLDDPVIEFFTEHMVADEDHSSRALQLVETLVDTEELQRRTLRVAEIALKSRWAGINDVYRTAVLGQRDILPPGVMAA